MGCNSGRKKQAAPPSATPTKEQLIAELESLDTVQARIDCIAADIKSKKNHYDCLGWDESLEFVGLRPGNEACWGCTKYGRRKSSVPKPDVSSLSPISNGAAGVPVGRASCPTGLQLRLRPSSRRSVIWL